MLLDLRFVLWQKLAVVNFIHVLDEMGRSCSMNGEKRNAYSLLLGKSEVKRPLGRPRRGWVDNIRMDLGEVGWGDVDWNGLAKDRNRWRALVNSVLILRVP
jgi:hypothetical protein